MKLFQIYKKTIPFERIFFEASNRVLGVQSGDS